MNSRKEIVDYNERVKKYFMWKKTSASAAFLYHDEDFLRAVGRAYRSERSREVYDDALWESIPDDYGKNGTD